AAQGGPSAADSPSGPHDGPDGRGREDNEEKIMSTVYTMSALQNRSDLELYALLRQARYDLDCSLAGSSDRRDALVNLDVIGRVIAQRRARPRPPGF
ncbi:MAG TPA: hypothetical protein VHY10_05475, partial [Xanthobacteraceae bacterium]|nr:hypothetical protein [Xanthobacteraceae bacterium]